ncbi:recombinase family protein [Rarobacter incanus]|uniref:Resolvase-like protein n=1 Tax=Rarobacter incanus TaxID=153494 RepID=A0A542SS13_9MICO|nr:recombinase family protein [Rarobacter incanus]TQK77047.1 resolvase-like protein [Rarobacter incanus]
MAGLIVGLVTDTEGLPAVAQQRADLAEAGGVGADIRSLSARTQEDWHYGIASVLEDLGAGDTVLVTDLGAFGTRIDDVVERLAALVDRGVRFRSLNDGIDTGNDSAFGDAMVTLARAVQAGRDARTRAALRAYGGVHGATPPKARFVDEAAYLRVKSQD